MCTTLTNQRSKLIDGSLAATKSAERNGFLQSVQGLGYAPCQIIC